MSKSRNIFLFILFQLLFNNLSAHSEVKLPALISDNMVLQRGANMRIWGWADPGESVTVNFVDQHKTAVTGSQGKWRINLDPMKAGGPYEMNVSVKN